MTVRLVFLPRLPATKGQAPNDHDKEDHSHREDVDLWAAIPVRSHDFRRHVALGPDCRAQGRGRHVAHTESEVSDLELIRLVEQKVLRFQISVRDPLIVEVADSVDHLSKKVTRDVLRKGSAMLLHHREEVASLHKFEHNEEYLDTVAGGLDLNLSIQVVFKQFDHARVIAVRQQRHLVGEHPLELG